jgi:YidC/Oxa1 family membrane protein insertase
MDKLTPELRILGASLLSMVIILLWVKFFAPKPPPPQPKPVISAPQSPSSVSPTTTSGAAASAAAQTPTAASGKPATPVSVTPKSAGEEHSTIIQNDLYRVEISNRGAVVKSWQLSKYLDDNKPQRVLDVVHPEAAQQTGGWPFALVIDNPDLEKAANNGLYQLSSSADTLTAPAEVEYSWSDGHLEITKHFHFDHSYVVRVDATAKLDGKPILAGLGWLGGFGDLTVSNPAPVETVTSYYSEGGKIVNFPHKKLEGLDHWPPGVWQGGKDFAGIEDRYFTAAFVPANGAAPGTLQTRYWKTFRPV